MRFSDLFEPERALALLVKLAVSLIGLSILLQFAFCLLRQIPPAAEFGILCILMLFSPLAYFIRQWRRGGRERSGSKRGAERTPLLPQNEEVQ